MASPSIPLPSSSPIKKSRVRVSAILLLSILLTAVLLSPTSSSAAKIPYSPHCSSFVPESSTAGDLLAPSDDLLQIYGGHFAGGERILGGHLNSTLSIPRSFSFRHRSIRKTLSPQTLSLTGILTFRGGGIGISTPGRSLRLRVYPRNPRAFNRGGRASFNLEGFWSELSGRLCMVGEGFGRSREGISLELSAVFKLNYPNATNISSAVVYGTVESLDDSGSVNYFDPIRLFAYDERNYEFTKVPYAMSSCSVVEGQNESLGFENVAICAHPSSNLMQSFWLEYKGNCSELNCAPFGRSLGFLPRFMSFSRLHCLEDGRVRMSMGFSRQITYLSRSFESEKTLVGEGAWDPVKKRFCLIACRLANKNGSLLQEYMGDCSIGFSLWFPSVLSIDHLSTVYGRIWSLRNENDSEYFDTVSFGNVYGGLSSFRTSHGLKYKYTKTDLVKKSCVKSNAPMIGKRRYPNVDKAENMRFSLSVKDAGGKNAVGYADLLFVGETHYGNSLYNSFSRSGILVPASIDVNHGDGHWNISYHIRYGDISNAHEQTEISAEGTYDVGTGVLCMVGCRHESAKLDCGILINIQLASLNPKEGEYTKGSIWSTREKSDPLFFEPLEITSYVMYTTQAAQSITWMDIEIAMVIVSLTLSCVFIGLQIYHIKKHPNVLPSISITMLVILTLGHMIPLVLSFEDLLSKNHNRQNALLRSGGWLQVNEVVVRVITMVAFLLLCRLLQVAWSAKSAEEGEKELWIAERKSLLVCLPLYIAGGLVALCIHYFGTQQKILFYGSVHYRSLWEDLMSYAGLLLDGFLFPQFLLNLFCNSKERSLAPAFYVGTTVVRAFPHVYDAYRAHHYLPHLRSSYIYASRNRDLYSSAWDIIIPSVGVLFAVLICLQQRFGGAFVLPRRIKDAGGYEMVPVVSQ